MTRNLDPSMGQLPQLPGDSQSEEHIQKSVKAMQPERITIKVPEAPDGVPSMGMVAVTQGGTRKGYTVLGSMMGLQRSFWQCFLHAIWVSLQSAKKKEVPERRTEPIN
ncbi:hypothetical protein GGU10DRAFT_334343 [Lentinula aff. detonsa]|uniref:Uncharacterized protein n=1 Tax=Lentinula aff. detonsa TaxID=2804958 RepID=A0AA38KFE0_9AGAR|nr:hypothetical protein GGU10DRAFT_334343 [Lentinula aff. detonsa]